MLLKTSSQMHKHFTTKTILNKKVKKRDYNLLLWFFCCNYICITINDMISANRVHFNFQAIFFFGSLKLILNKGNLQVSMYMFISHIPCAVQLEQDFANCTRRFLWIFLCVKISFGKSSVSLSSICICLQILMIKYIQRLLML